MRIHKLAIFIIMLLATSRTALANDIEVRGYIGAEARLFAPPLEESNKSSEQFSLTFEPEVYWAWDRDNSITFKPYARLDSLDDERTHADIRELMYLHVNDGWEFRAGIGKVFWGVTETVHLVDVINQNDSVEAIDGEDKLGQPMLQFSLLKDWGVLDFFVLPGFRERTFPGPEGRLGGEVTINQDKALYESDDGQSHIDFAVSWRHMFEDLDVSLNGFTGTSREPFLQAEVNAEGQPTGQLVPFYPQITQIGALAQYVYQDWLWKVESVNRSGDMIEDHTALVGGFEYTWVGVLESYTDIGFVAEYAWDERGKESFQAIAQNDLAVAARFTLNDISSSEILVGLTQDLDYSDSRALFVEASTRVGESGSLNLDMWMFHSENIQEPSYAFRGDDFIQLSYQYYF